MELGDLWYIYCVLYIVRIITLKKLLEILPYVVWVRYNANILMCVNKKCHYLSLEYPVG